MSVPYRDQFEHWDAVKNKFAAFERQFPPLEHEEDIVPVPVVTIKDMSELEDEDAFVAMLDAKMLEANCAIIKVKLPQEYVNNLRSVPQYPRLRALHVTVEREAFTKYGNDEGVYIRNHFTHIPETTYESMFAARMQNGYGAPFEAKAGSSWTKAETELFKNIAEGKHKAVYAPELEGSLFPDTFEPLNINKLTGVLRKMMMVQGIVPGISQSMTYLGRAGATFPWHVEDEMLYSFNYLHFGAGKVWYAAGAGVKEYEKVVAAFRSLYPEEYIHCKNAHMHKEFFVHPDVLCRRYGVKVAKTVQRPGELICTRPYGFHAGFSLGNNAGEASNWGNDPLWLKTIAKEVREEHHYCDCTRSKPVILNHQCLDRSESKKQKKRISELERMVENLAQELELLKASKADTSRSRSSLAKKEDDYGVSVATGAPRQKPGRKPGTRNTWPHKAGGPRFKKKTNAGIPSTSRSSSPADMDYEDAPEG